LTAELLTVMACGLTAAPEMVVLAPLSLKTT
jgi:hypothetical protein